MIRASLVSIKTGLPTIWFLATSITWVAPIGVMPAVKKTNSNTTAFAAPFIGSYTIPSLTGNSDVYLPTNSAEEPEIEVSGNDESYNIHFRTDNLWFPWQAYRFSFNATPDWQTYRIPFSKLEPYKTTKRFSQDEIIRIGLVAIGREFQANLCIASIKFYIE